MFTRMIGAELLKLRKRRGLFWGSLFLVVGGLIIVLIIAEGLHLADPTRHGPVGGAKWFDVWLMGLFLAGSVVAVILGAVAGTADVSSGVFRDLVATGRSRWQLFTARIPGALALLIPIITLGYMVVVGISLAFAGGKAVPDPSLILQSYGWILLSMGFNLVLALGLASLIGSRGAAIGVLLGWQFIASPLLEQVHSLGALRQGLYTAALARLNPVAPLFGPGARSVTSSLTVATLVLIIWAGLILAAGAWRTATRDA